MILHTEELRQKAHELALTHDSCHSRLPAFRLKHRLAAAVRQLRAFRDELRTAPAGCSQPAEEWLLDNAEFIEEQVLVVRQQLSGSFLRLLPRLRKSGEPRVLALCSDYLEHVDSYLDEEALIAYINGYQEVAVLSLAEAWSFPLILRIALLLRLAEVMQLVRERREACLLVQRLLARLEPARLDPSRLKDALEEAGQDLPLSGPVIVHLIKQLREWADDSATVREWLVCKLENEPESLDKIVAFEYQLQASYQVITGNIISSLRTIARWDWRDAFERISLVERTLRQECTGMYQLLDFSSRDLLRRQKLSSRARTGSKRGTSGAANQRSKDKAEVMADKLLEINPSLQLEVHRIYLEEPYLEQYLGSCDAIVDAIDSMGAKMELIRYGLSTNKVFLSSMGMANRLDPTQLEVTNIEKTYNDPFAKKIRLYCKQQGLKNLKVVSSKELPTKNDKMLTSFMPVTASAGLLLASQIMKDLLEKL